MNLRLLLIAAGYLAGLFVSARYNRKSPEDIAKDVKAPDRIKRLANDFTEIHSNFISEAKGTMKVPFAKENRKPIAVKRSPGRPRKIVAGTMEDPMQSPRKKRPSEIRKQEENRLKRETRKKERELMKARKNLEKMQQTEVKGIEVPSSAGETKTTSSLLGVNRVKRLSKKPIKSKEKTVGK